MLALSSLFLRWRFSLQIDCLIKLQIILIFLMASFLPWQVVHSDPGLWPSAHLRDEKPSHTISGRYTCIWVFRTQKTQVPMHKYNQENNQITKDSNVFSQGCSQLTSSGLSNLIQLRQVYFSWTISNNRNMYFLYFSRIIIINAIQLPAWRAWVDQLSRIL